jgi:hypothetical protein
MAIIQMIYSNVPENDYEIYSPSTSYPANAIVMWPYYHSNFMSLVDNNLGNGLLDKTKWLYIGRNNRWRVHDESIGNSTTNPLSIRNIYKFAGALDFISLLGVTATAVSVKVYNSLDQLAYSKTKTLNLVSNGASWNDFYYSTLSQLSADLLFDDLPFLINPVVDIEITAPSESVKCGEIIFGTQLKFGETQYGAKLGITDYSQKTQDQFGNYSVTPRGFRRTGDFNVMIANSNIDYFINLLARYRAQAVLCVGSNSYTSSMIYGFIKEWGITIQYPQHSLFNITVEGLT